MNIKRIYCDEAGQVINLFDKYRVFYKQTSDMELAKEFINERLRNNESVIYVAFTDAGDPVGFTQLYPKYSSVRAVRNWILNDLYVDESYRENGIGEKLIAAAVDWSKQTGPQFLQLETAHDNYSAQSLYKSTGFIQQSADDKFILFKIGI